MNALHHLRRFDWILFASVIVLLILGSFAIASVAFSHDPPDWHRTVKHFVFVAIALLFILFGSRVDYRSLRAVSRPLYIVGILLLVAVLFIGETVRGTRGWFSWSGFTWQPVELIKLLLLVFLAKYFEQWARDIDRIRHIIVSGVGVFLYIALIFFQPDVGSAFLLFCTWFGMVVVIGMRRRHVALLLLCSVAIGVVGWAVLLKDYQRSRISTFFAPESDPLGRGYNATQALIAIGGGQLTGRGFGFGTQSQLKFLPEADTDFIFAVIAEEWGFIGITLLLTAWGVFFWRCIIAIQRARDDFSLFFIVGALLLFFIEASVTIGMNVGLLPVTGLTLPFVSYGGSSLLAHSAVVTMMQSSIIRARS